MEFLLSKTAVVGLAVLGAFASTLASALQARKAVGEARARQLNLLGYGFMGLSILLFIIAGLRT